MLHADFCYRHFESLPGHGKNSTVREMILVRGVVCCTRF
jgi:hypothetical protein